MRTEDTSLAHLLFGQTRGRLLATLYGTPDETFFVRQLARRVEVSVGSVQRELMTLADAGLVVRSQIGNQVFYRANRHHPVYAELQALLAKTAGIFHQLSEALAPLANEIEFALVYGSFARGDETAASDVDLIVVGKVTLDELLELIVPVERSLERPVNPTVYSSREVRTKLKAGNHFLKAIQEGKATFLIGDEHEFRKLL
ncbi:MAG: nucleotidyltransferase domain-containing protein [Acidobacteriaceae bacterium]